MKVQIIKFGATGDVISATPLLRRLGGELNWKTASNTVVLSMAWRRTPDACCLDLSGRWGDGRSESNAGPRPRVHAGDE